jgi:Beta-lactamase associated winged helix domain
VLQGIVAHRLKREGKVLASLRRLSAQHGADSTAPHALTEAPHFVDAQALVVAVYDDVPPSLHPMAQRSLAAHLIKLEADGMAIADAQGCWAPTTHSG